MVRRLTRRASMARLAVILATLALLGLSLPEALASTSSPRPGLGLTFDRMDSGHPAVVSQGGDLVLTEGKLVQPWDFTGINAYQLTSRWGLNDGCGWGGWTAASLDGFFAGLPPNAMVRTWFFQSDATQVTAGQARRDWTALDQVVAAADAHNVHLILTLGNEDGTCDDGVWKGPSWYAGGYGLVDTAPGTPTGPGLTSYGKWVHDAVSRYAARPSVAMWEPMNEPQPATCTASPGWDCWGQRTCPDEAAASRSLLSFYDHIGEEIHHLDPGKLVSDGSFGGGGCGTADAGDFVRAISSPGIDVTGYHDYSGLAQPIDLARREAESAAAGKPTMVGEAGVTGCSSAAERARIYGEKIAAAERDGVSAYLAWWYDGDGGNPTCNGPLAPDSPAWAAILTRAGPSAPLRTS